MSDKHAYLFRVDGWTYAVIASSKRRAINYARRRGFNGRCVGKDTRGRKEQWDSMTMCLGEAP